MKEYEELELLMTAELQQWAGMIDKDLPEKWGFALLVFPFVEDDAVQSVLYVSSAERESMIASIETLLPKWRAELPGQSENTT